VLLMIPSLRQCSQRGDVVIGNETTQTLSPAKKASRHGHAAPPQRKWSVAKFALLGVVVTAAATVLVALISVASSAVSSYYSAVQQCNKDADALETQLTSILIEISGREDRIKALLSVPVKSYFEKETGELHDESSLNNELAAIEIGDDKHYEDPLFKDHSLVQLISQYNRLLRRIEFPPCVEDETKSGVKSQSWCPNSGLDIDTKTMHPNIQTKRVFGQLATVYSKVYQDLSQIDRQQNWHEQLGPVHMCSEYSILTKEPWKLISLQLRSKS
jgi:hypothetical protein